MTESTLGVEAHETMRVSPSRSSLSTILEELFPEGRDWVNQALCRGVSKEEREQGFVPLRGSGKRGKAKGAQLSRAQLKALAICLGCPVKAECLLEEIEFPQSFDLRGQIRGCLTHEQRTLVRDALMNGTLAQEAPGVLASWRSKADVERFVEGIPHIKLRRRFRNRGTKPHRVEPDAPKSETEEDSYVREDGLDAPALPSSRAITEQTDGWDISWDEARDLIRDMILTATTKAAIVRAIKRLNCLSEPEVDEVEDGMFLVTVSGPEGKLIQI